MDTTRMQDEEPGAGRTTNDAFGGSSAHDRPAGELAHGEGAGSRAGTTSASTRDAARLRSVMQSGGERTEMRAPSVGDVPLPASADIGISGAHMQDRGDLARAAGMPSLPDLDREPIPAGVERRAVNGGNAIEDDLSASAGAGRPTSLRTPIVGSSGNQPLAAEPLNVAGPKHATRLKPVDALQAKNERGIAAAGVASASPVDRDTLTPDQHPMPVFTEIERKESYSYGTDDHIAPSHMAASEPPISAQAYATEPAPTAQRIEPGEYIRSRRTTRRGFGRAPIAVAMVTAGTAIGIALYAGGGDLLSKIFSNSKEGVSVVSPSTVTERPVAPPQEATAEATTGIAANVAPQGGVPVDTTEAMPQHAERAGMAPVEQAQGPDPAQMTQHAAPVEREAIVVDDDEEKQASPRGAGGKHDTLVQSRAATAPKPPVDAPVKAKTDDRKNTDKAKLGDKTKPTDKGKPAAPATAKSDQKDAAGKYMVQVRATPDEAEAKLIAKRLRSKGASGVTIVPSKAKDGSTFYKVRYNTSGSRGDAESAATRAGYKDVWVVKQK